MPADFEKQEYWHDRFATETRFEWLATSDEFMRILEADADFSKLLEQKSRCPSPPRILHVGSGTSDLQNYLRAAGIGSVLNVDYEPLAVDRGRALEEAQFGDVRMGYAVADATRLDVDLGLGESNEEKFDLVIDKSTVDAVSCGGEEAVLRMCRAVGRFLAPGGFWISLSYSGSRFDIEGLPFTCEVIARIPTTKLKETDPDVYHHCYKLTPGGDESRADR
ncbi:S-adenosyl-L-methionine-dependent methyltransferase [Diaporthe sp. PMI_573]|nr:S-adenosyl-L-methionine-dependent methyltransferase [Diaporthaceae sp. PMI_573]